MANKKEADGMVKILLVNHADTYYNKGKEKR